MNSSSDFPKANVLGVGIDAINMRQALARIEQNLQHGIKGYVCLIGVHGVMEARRDPGLVRTYAGATLAAPDGMPTVWVGRHQGHSAMKRVTGPDLMLEIMQGEQFRNVSHFFYGGKPGVAEELRGRFMERFPFLNIVGTFTPPFGPLSPQQSQEFISTIDLLRPDIIWVGISTPRQDRFMEQYLPLLDTTLMFGVGAAFDFHTGRIADCAEWIKLAGLQWVDRLLQDPKHLWKRYLRNNPPFLLHILLQLLGIRKYPMQPEYCEATPPAQSVEV